MSMPAIEVKDLSIGYDTTAVLKQANFAIFHGEIVTILGGSGCGKTTLLRNLIGLQAPLEGEIFIQGTAISDHSEQSLQYLKQHIGVMFQSGALLSTLTLLENVMLPLQTHSNLSHQLIQATALAKLRLVNLGKHAHYYPSEISGGMIKRAAIARAMALDPSILFLDEPSAGLDPITRTELDQLIYHLSRDFGMTFVIITHELATINAIADRGIVLNDQRVIANDSIDTIKAAKDSPFIQQFFNSNVRTPDS